MYSLYGIVEHSGGMYGGHYVAYVKVRNNLIAFYCVNIWFCYQKCFNFVQKVRPNLTPDDPRWKFLPKGSKVELDQTDEQKARLDEALRKTQLKENRRQAGDSDDSTSSSSTDCSGIRSNESSQRESPPIVPAPPEGKWYYVSDSHVMEVTEDRVKNAQAYLLFYERTY